MPCPGPQAVALGLQRVLRLAALLQLPQRPEDLRGCGAGSGRGGVGRI